ncbi:hypothetical protein ACXR0O_10675 [Verrucomicrobiota bacterium sgz303538]
MIPAVDTTPALTASFTAADHPPASAVPESPRPSEPARPKERSKDIPRFNPVRVMRATANPIRWGVLELLSQGTPLAAVHLAQSLRADHDNVIRHLHHLEAEGLIVAYVGEDARFRLYGIRPALEAGIQDGMRLYDLGFCVLRFPIGPGQ